MNEPLVSVVMPVYNTASYLEEAMDSILRQSYENLELIAVNDGSTDASGEILARYEQADGRVRVLSQENAGISAARNKGMEAASGKYIAVMDSDDVSLPERLAKQVALMESRPDVGLCGTRCAFFGDMGEYVGAAPPTDPERIKCSLLFLPTISHTSVMMRRDLVINHALRYSPDLEVAEDYEFYTQFLPYCRITNLPDVLMGIRTHRESTTRRIAGDKGLGVVHKQQLEALGIHPTEEELGLHLSISVGDLGKSRDHIDGVESWLCRLLTANRASRIYGEKALAADLFQRWLCACFSEYKLGMWTWRKFRASELSRGFRTPVRHRVAFAARCLLKRQQLKPSWLRANIG